MSIAVVHITPFLAGQTFFGMSVPTWWSWLCARAGLEARVVVDDPIDGDEGHLRVDGRFLGIAPHDLADLDEHDGVLVTQRPEDVVVAAGRSSRARLGRRAKGQRRTPIGDEIAAVVDFASLEAAEHAARWRSIEELRRAGVRMIDPSRVVASPTVVVAAGCVLWPDVTLLGNTHVGPGTTIHTGCHLSDTVVGAGAVLKPYTVADGAHVGDGAHIGPFAHLRPGTWLGDRVHIGNFVETKAAMIGAGSKANHLSYLGDVQVGEETNIGAGTITCNYDGAQKHRTSIGSRTFIGTNTSLVAPIAVGDDCLVAAGAVLTEAVPDRALALARAAQVTVPEKGQAILARNRARRAEADARRAAEATSVAAPAVPELRIQRVESLRIEESTSPSMEIPAAMLALREPVVDGVDPGAPDAGDGGETSSLMSAEDAPYPPIARFPDAPAARDPSLDEEPG